MGDGKENTYSIGDIARSIGISARTVRYYEEIGLLNSIKRVEHGKRVYTDEHIRRLKFIKKLKLLGLSLSEMQDLEKIYRVHKTKRKFLPRLISLLEEHAKRIDDRIMELSLLKGEINEYRKRMERKFNDEVRKEENRRAT